MSCAEACLETVIPICDFPVLKLGLTADTTFQVVITRPGSQKVYKREVLTDGTGAIGLNPSDFPPGFFGYGYLELEVMKAPEFTEIQPLTKDGNTYNCLLMELADIDE